MPAYGKEDAMLDKIEAISKDFEVEDRPKLTVVPAPIDMETGECTGEHILYYNKSGEPVKGKKAYRNIEFASISLNKYGMHVAFCPAKVVHGCNYLKLNNADELNTSVKRIQDTLQETGIHTNLETFKLSRLDLCKDAEMQEPVFSYFDLFRVLNGKYEPHKRQEPHGYYFGNKSRTAVFYDKGEEMTGRGIDIDTYGMKGKNMMRCEARLTGGRPVERHSGLVDIHSLNNRDAFESLRPIYKSMLTDFVFRTADSTKQMRIVLNEEVETLKYFRQAYKRNALMQYMTFKALQGGIVYKDTESIKHLLQEAGFNIKYIQRTLKEYERLTTCTQFIRKKYDGKRTVASLYDEVYTKMVA